MIEFERGTRSETAWTGNQYEVKGGADPLFFISSHSIHLSINGMHTTVKRYSTSQFNHIPCLTDAILSRLNVAGAAAAVMI